MNRCALLVIDVQLGAFDGQRTPAIHEGDQLLERISGLIGAARSAEIPVIFAQHCGSQGQVLIENTPPWEIHPSVAPKPADFVVLKRESSAFNGTQLQELLERQGIHTVITCGIQSEYCLSNTSVSALELGLSVYVAQDAHGTLPTDNNAASAIIDLQNTLLAKQGASIQSSASLMEMLTAN